MRRFLLWCYLDWERKPVSGTACLLLYAMAFCEFMWGNKNIGWHALILAAIFAGFRGPFKED